MEQDFHAERFKEFLREVCTGETLLSNYGQSSGEYHGDLYFLVFLW